MSTWSVWPLPPALLRTALPLVGGSAIAALTFVLMRMSPVWTAMLLAGTLAVLPAFLVRDRMHYWLILFLATLPFDVTKVFMEPERAISLVETLGAPGGPISPYVHLIDLAFLPLFATWAWGKLRRRERIWFPGIHWLPVAFLVLTSVTALTAPGPYFALLGVVKQAKYFILYVVVADALPLHRYGRTILVVLLVTLGLQGATTLGRYQFQYFDPLLGQALGRGVEDVRGEAEGTRRVATDDPDSPDRGFGTFYHANVTAIHLELLVPFALVGALASRRRKYRVACGLLFLLGVAGHFVTFSRAGLMALIFALGLCLALAAFRGLIPRRWIPAFALASALGFLAIVPVAALYMQTRPAETAFHFDHVRHGLAIAMENPWFGVGLNNSSFARDVVVGSDLFYLGHMLPIHSHHLIILSETGVFGYALFVGFFASVGVLALRRSRSRSALVQVFSIGVLGAYGALFIHVATDWLGFEASHVMLWLYAGVIVGMGRPMQVASGEVE